MTDDNEDFTAREQRRASTARKKALHDAAQEEGYVRSVFLREQDFVAHDTRVVDMQGEGFARFWLTDIYGGEVFEPFEHPGGHAGPEHLWRGVIVRRFPGPGAAPELEEPVILVDLDACEGLVHVPPEVWQYAFEHRAGERELDLIDLTSSVQVILASAKTGLLVKGPACLLLLLAQDQYSFETVTPEEVRTLAADWGQVWALQDRCAAMLAKPPGGGAGAMNTFGITIDFPRLRVLDLLQTCLGGSSQFLQVFLREAWLLAAGPTVRGWNEGTVGDEGVTGDLLASIIETPNRANTLAEGEPYFWLSVTWQGREHKLRNAWGHAPRIARCKQLGGHYYLNTNYGATALPPTVRWAQVEHMRFLKPSHLRVQPVRLGNAGAPFPLRSFLSSDQAGELATATEFATFWTQVFHRALSLVEHRDGWFLFRDREAVDVDGTPELRETDVIVKNFSLPARVKPYCGGVQGYLDLFSLNGYPTRWFVFDPRNECVERDASVLRSILQGEIGKVRGSVDFVVRSLLQLREETRLNGDVQLGDLLGNVAVSMHVNQPEGVQSVVNAWVYRDRYVPVVKDERELGLAKSFLEKVKSGDYKKESIVLWHLRLEQFRMEHPEEYKAFQAEAERYFATEIAELAEQEKAELAEDGDEEEGIKRIIEEDDTGGQGGSRGSRIGQWENGKEIIDEDEYVIYYRSRDGYYSSEEKEDSTFDEDFAHQYDLTPEEKAGKRAEGEKPKEKNPNESQKKQE